MGMELDTVRRNCERKEQEMKSQCMMLATALAGAVLAAVPLAWEARPERPAPAMFDRYHGETLEFRCALRGFGELPFASGADVRLWYQTNGMGADWWSAPAAVSSNVLTATWSPEVDPGADRVSLFFGAPGSVYAAAVLRLRHSPGFAPGSLPDPETFQERDPVFAAWLAGWEPPVVDLTPATNYTDAVAAEFADGTRTAGNAARLDGLAYYDIMSMVQSMVDAIPRPDYSAGNAALVATIAAVAPAPGDYANVSNRAMEAVSRAEAEAGFTAWRFEGLPAGAAVGETMPEYVSGSWNLYFEVDGSPYLASATGGADATSLVFSFGMYEVTATRARLGAAVPGAPEEATALRWKADGTACVVTVGAGGTLAADLTGWTEGQAVMAIVTLAEGAGIGEGIVLSGYGTWPRGEAFAACCYRVGVTVYVVPLTTL